MLIGEVMKATGLTRKAIHYYESVGLVSPRAAGNGYREYSDADVERLRTVAALRGVDMPLRLVQDILARPAELAGMLEGYLETLKAERQLLDGRMEAVRRMAEQAERGLPLATAAAVSRNLGDKLKAAFPGSFGRMLEAHFQPFLGAEADTKEKRAALEDIVAYLDGLEIELPELLPDSPGGVEEAVQKDYWNEIGALLAMPEAERAQKISSLKARKEEMEASLKQNAPAEYQELLGKSQRMAALLKDTGYYEHVVANLRALSPEYSRYLDAMERLQLACFEA